MKRLNVLVVAALAVAIGAGWLLTMSKLGRLERHVALIESRPLSHFSDSAQDKSESYLVAARENTNDCQVCELLYRAAIMLREDKRPLLSEYAKWCQDSVKNLVDKGLIDDAERRCASLVSFFDSVIETGSVSDICSIPELTQQLAEVKRIVEAARRQAEKEQLAVLDKIEESIPAETNYYALIRYRADVDAVELPDELSERKERLERILILKASTVVPETEPVIVPPVGEDTPWIAWLENFKDRLGSYCLTDEIKASDFAKAGEFLASAKEIDEVRVKIAVVEIEELGASICRRVWRTTVLAATSKADPSKEDIRRCVELLATADEFSEEEQKLCRDELVALNRAIVVASLREIRQQADSAKELRYKLSTDEYQQLLSMLQGQCLQMLIKLQVLNLKYGGFRDDIERVCAAVSGFSEVVSGSRKTQEANSIIAQKNSDKKFLDWVKSLIEYAEYYYQLGEKKAKEWRATTSNEYAQRQYKKAWEAIMEVNSGDLGALDDALLKLWNREKEKIENRFTPSDGDLKNRTYRGRDSFR